MKLLRIILLALVCTAALAGEIGNYSNDPAPSSLGRIAIDEGCPSASPCSTGTTYDVTLLQIWNPANWVSGTNNQATVIFGSGSQISCSGTGVCNANKVNGTAVPANAGVLGSNASGQLVSQLSVQLTTETFAAINAIGCTANNAGALYYVTDSNVATGSTITAGGGANKVLALCTGSAWIAH